MMMNSQVFNLHEAEGSWYLTAPSLEKTGLVEHLFPTRIGGFSPQPFGLHFGITSQDDPANVRKNYEWAARVLHSDVHDFVVSAQTHSANILRVTSEHRGCGVTRPRDISGIDGLTTNEEGIVLVTIHADCVPVFFLDPVRRAIGMAHAGWKGTASGIVSCMVDRMAAEYGTQSRDLVCVIAPSIGPRSFEVREDVRQVFEKSFGAFSSEIIKAHPENHGKYRDDPHFLIDLWKANRYWLIQKGVPEENITVTDLDTCENPEIFHSYRRTGTPGRMGAMLSLKKQKSSGEV